MYFTFDGISSTDMGLKIKNINNLSSPKRKYRDLEIYGRGNLSIDEGNYENFTITIECLILGEAVETKAKDIKAWLQGAGGVKPLIISNEPDKVYPAIYKGVVDIVEVTKYVNTVLLSFECKVGYTKGANQLIILDKNAVITNMGTIESEPLIRVYGNSIGTLYVDKIPIQLDLTNSVYLELDSELMNCTDDNNSTNANQLMVGDFPIFYPGDTSIEWVGNITRVEIMPRWRSL